MSLAVQIRYALQLDLCYTRNKLVCYEYFNLKCLDKYHSQQLYVLNFPINSSYYILSMDYINPLSKEKMQGYL